MANAEDIGNLSMSMRVCYGPQWKHDTPEALQVWANALAHYNREQIDKAMAGCLDYYIDFAPTLPQFLRMIRESVSLLPGSAEANRVAADAVYAYAKPQSNHNPKGNPHGISLPESIAKQRHGESVESYNRRTACAVTRALHQH
jgi:hypothetical protein